MQARGGFVLGMFLFSVVHIHTNAHGYARICNGQCMHVQRACLFDFQSRFSRRHMHIYEGVFVFIDLVHTHLWRCLRLHWLAVLGSHTPCYNVRLLQMIIPSRSFSCLFSIDFLAVDSFSTDFVAVTHSLLILWLWILSESYIWCDITT